MPVAVAVLSLGQAGGDGVGDAAGVGVGGFLEGFEQQEIGDRVPRGDRDGDIGPLPVIRGGGFRGVEGVAGWLGRVERIGAGAGLGGGRFIVIEEFLEELLVGEGQGVVGGFGFGVALLRGVDLLGGRAGEGGELLGGRGGGAGVQVDLVEQVEGEAATRRWRGGIRRRIRRSWGRRSGATRLRRGRGWLRRRPGRCGRRSAGFA